MVTSQSQSVLESASALREGDRHRLLKFLIDNADPALLTKARGMIGFIQQSRRGKIIKRSERFKGG